MAVTFEQSDKMIKVLVTSAILVAGKHVEEGEYLTIKEGEGRHLAACNKVAVGTASELEELRKPILEKLKAEADEAAKAKAAKAKTN